jgi:hypothetical protein
VKNLNRVHPSYVYCTSNITTMETHTRRMPVAVHDHIQTICARQDQQFIYDVAKILGIPANEMRRKVLGVLGTPTVVLADASPWWVNTQCPIMKLTDAGMWIRCGNMNEAHGTCWRHRFTKGPLFHEPHFKTMANRVPFRYDNEMYWVAEDGSVLDSTGTIEMEFTVDLKSCTVFTYNRNDTKSTYIHGQSIPVQTKDETETQFTSVTATAEEKNAEHEDAVAT